MILYCQKIARKFLLALVGLTIISILLVSLSAGACTKEDLESGDIDKQRKCLIGSDFELQDTTQNDNYDSEWDLAYECGAYWYLQPTCFNLKTGETSSTNYTIDNPYILGKQGSCPSGWIDDSARNLTVRICNLYKHPLGLSQSRCGAKPGKWPSGKQKCATLKVYNGTPTGEMNLNDMFRWKAVIVPAYGTSGGHLIHYIKRKEVDGYKDPTMDEIDKLGLSKSLEEEILNNLTDQDKLFKEQVEIYKNAISPDKIIVDGKLEDRIYDEETNVDQVEKGGEKYNVIRQYRLCMYRSKKTIGDIVGMAVGAALTVVTIGAVGGPATPALVEGGSALDNRCSGTREYVQDNLLRNGPDQCFDLYRGQSGFQQLFSSRKRFRDYEIVPYMSLKSGKKYDPTKKRDGFPSNRTSPSLITSYFDSDKEWFSNYCVPIPMGIKLPALPHMLYDKQAVVLPQKPKPVVCPLPESGSINFDQTKVIGNSKGKAITVRKYPPQCSEKILRKFYDKLNSSQKYSNFTRPTVIVKVGFTTDEPTPKNSLGNPMLEDENKFVPVATINNNKVQSNTTVVLQGDFDVKTVNLYAKVLQADGSFEIYQDKPIYTIHLIGRIDKDNLKYCVYYYDNTKSVEEEMIDCVPHRDPKPKQVTLKQLGSKENTSVKVTIWKEPQTNAKNKTPNSSNAHVFKEVRRINNISISDPIQSVTRNPDRDTACPPKTKSDGIDCDCDNTTSCVLMAGDYAVVNGREIFLHSYSPTELGYVNRVIDGQVRDKKITQKQADKAKKNLSVNKNPSDSYNEIKKYIINNQKAYATQSVKNRFAKKRPYLNLYGIDTKLDINMLNNTKQKKHMLDLQPAEPITIQGAHTYQKPLTATQIREADTRNRLAISLKDKPYEANKVDLRYCISFKSKRSCKTTRVATNDNATLFCDIHILGFSNRNISTPVGSNLGCKTFDSSGNNKKDVVLIDKNKGSFHKQKVDMFTYDTFVRDTSKDIKLATGQSTSYYDKQYSAIATMGHEGFTGSKTLNMYVDSSWDLFVAEGDGKVYRVTDIKESDSIHHNSARYCASSKLICFDLLWQSDLLSCICSPEHKKNVWGDDPRKMQCDLDVSIYSSDKLKQEIKCEYEY